MIYPYPFSLSKKINNWEFYKSYLSCIKDKYLELGDGYGHIRTNTRLVAAIRLALLEKNLAIPIKIIISDLGFKKGDIKNLTKYLPKKPVSLDFYLNFAAEYYKIPKEKLEEICKDLNIAADNFLNEGNPTTTLEKIIAQAKN
ncbi:MAG: hypothetical protein QXQ79_01870 [Candidatus Nanoarchaeia archaeon]